MRADNNNSSDPHHPSDNVLALRAGILNDDKSWVELQDLLPHPNTGVSPDASIVNAARVSFLGHSKGADADRKLLFYLLKSCLFIFNVCGIKNYI